MYVKLLKNKLIYIFYQIKKVLYHAEEIGISLGTGLSRVWHHVNDFVNEKADQKITYPTGGFLPIGPIRNLLMRTMVMTIMINLA